MLALFRGAGSCHALLYLLDFGVPEKPRVSPLPTVWNEMLQCGQEGDEGNNTVRQSVLDSVRFPDLNGDGVQDVSIVARTGTVQRSDADYEACQSGAWTPPPVHTPAYRIDYVLRGDRLILTRRSVSAIKHFPHSDVFQSTRACRHTSAPARTVGNRGANCIRERAPLSTNLKPVRLATTGGSVATLYRVTVPRDYHGSRATRWLGSE